VFTENIINIIYTKIMKMLTTTQLSPSSCYFLFLVAKYSPKHHVLKLPSYLFIP
jgi:hypothetical protein